MRTRSRSRGRLASDLPSCASVEALHTPVVTETGGTLLSTVPAGSREKRLAFAVILISAVLCLAAVPFVRLALPKVPSFIPAYEAALTINDLITAVLLFGQFTRSRSRALLTLAGGYLFSGLVVIPHALTFPDAFSPTGLLGAGEQTTAWLYVFWHAGFPFFVLGYALLRDRGTAGKELHGDVRVTVMLLVICVGAIVGAITLLASWGMDLLPILIKAGDYSRLISTGTSPSILFLCLLALIALWRLRQPSVLEIWLMVVMCAWIFDVILSAVISSSRYDLGWYAGRSYGLLAATFVLVILLLETNSLHNRLAREEERELLLKQLTDSNIERGHFAHVAAHDLGQSVRMVSSFCGLLSANYGHQLDERGRQYVSIMANAALTMQALLDDLVEHGRLDFEKGDAAWLDAGKVLEEVLRSLGEPIEKSGAVVTNDPLPRIWTIPVRFARVLQNLVANAIKYVAPGVKPRVHVSVTTKADEWVFSVADNGIGIDPEYHARIFQPFKRLHTAKEYSGAGMGVAICKKIVEGLGGRISIESSLGAGSTFAFSVRQKREGAQDD